MCDSQTSNIPNQPSSAIRDDTPSEEDNQPLSNTYYYDDATGYEIYREGAEDEEESDRADETPE